MGATVEAELEALKGDLDAIEARIAEAIAEASRPPERLVDRGAVLVEFTVYGRAVPQGSKRAFTPRGWTRPVLVEASAALRPWRQQVSDSALAALAVERCGEPWTPYEGPVAVTIEVHRKRPPTHWLTGGLSLSAAGRRASVPGDGDIDKISRAILDALTGVVYRDDRQVCDLRATKAWSQNNGPDKVVIRVEATDGTEAV